MKKTPSYHYLEELTSLELFLAVALQVVVDYGLWYRTERERTLSPC